MPAPDTNNGYKSEKSWRAAVIRAVNRESEGKGSPKWLDRLANRLVLTGDKGDVSALKEIGDRLDGKPAQAIQIKGDPESPVIFNLRLSDGIQPKIIDGGAAEVLPGHLAGPLAATVTQDEES